MPTPRMDLYCCNCRRLVGHFDYERLPRAMAAALRGLLATFGADADATADDDERKPLPILCTECAK